MKTLPITGYLDCLSARAGEAVVAHVSVAMSTGFEARLVKVISADPNPDGPGLQLLDLSHVFRAALPGMHQPISPGSFAKAELGPAPDQDRRTWTALVQLRGEDCHDRAVISQEDGQGRRITLFAGRGGVRAMVSSGEGFAEVSASRPLSAGVWHRVWAACDTRNGVLSVGQAPVASSAQCGVGAAEIRSSTLDPPHGGTCMIGACCVANPTGHFNGRIEEPAILAGCRSDWRCDRADLEGSDLLARWDFSIGISTQEIADVGPGGFHGRLINCPTRAVRGARWTGEEMCWRHAPEHYAAIHFHESDLGDCGWAPSFTFHIPPDLQSGAYALHVSCPAGEDWLPFYVRCAEGSELSDVAFLAPTFTYQAYANHARGNCDADYRARRSAWGAYPYHPTEYPLYGRSLYDRHADGSGVCLSSRLRPILTMRPGFLTFVDEKGSGLRHYPADSHLIAWLDAKRVPFDVLTDEDLDQEGLSAIRSYRAVLTGTHPEYHTARTLDALSAYVDGGGKLAYLGGNGFYWRVGRGQDPPGMLEVRRAEGGVRSWESEPGESFHASDGQYGGLWRRNGRPPQALVGVGFTAQGRFEATSYLRTPASHAPQFSWMFAGVGEGALGDHGLSAGGAAGFELDRVDFGLGSPPDTVVLARSQSPPASFSPVLEDLLAPGMTVSGEPPDELVRSEIAYFETDGGGAVFAVGSITFCGSLWSGGWDGPVSRLLWNVLERFRRPRDSGDEPGPRGVQTTETPASADR